MFNFLKSLPQKPTLQQGLHIASPICDQQYVNLVISGLVDDPVGFEKYLAVLADTQGQEFLRAPSPLRKFGQASENFLDSL